MECDVPSGTRIQWTYLPHVCQAGSASPVAISREPANIENHLLIGQNLAVVGVIGESNMTLTGVQLDIAGTYQCRHVGDDSILAEWDLRISG